MTRLHRAHGRGRTLRAINLFACDGSLAEVLVFDPCARAQYAGTERPDRSAGPVAEARSRAARCGQLYGCQDEPVEVKVALTTEQAAHTFLKTPKSRRALVVDVQHPICRHIRAAVFFFEFRFGDSADPAASVLRGEERRERLFGEAITLKRTLRAV